MTPEQCSTWEAGNLMSGEPKFTTSFYRLGFNDQRDGYVSLPDGCTQAELTEYLDGAKAARQSPPVGCAIAAMNAQETQHG